MERPLMMVLHSVVIAFVLYIVMVALGQNYMVAETRSVFLGGLVLLYMILYGHGLPLKVNKMLF